MFLERLLLLLGAGFLVANLRLLLEVAGYLRRRRTAQLVWPPRRPPFFPVMLLIGFALVALLVSNVATGNLRFGPIFGEAMMLLYYLAAMPLGRRVRRGFYAEGVWTDSGFLPYPQIGGLSWREGPTVALVLLVKGRGAALRLTVPGDHYGAVRRLLRDKIASRQIHFEGIGLQLGGHDEREDV